MIGTGGLAVASGVEAGISHTHAVVARVLSH